MSSIASIVPRLSRRFHDPDRKYRDKYGRWLPGPLEFLNLINDEQARSVVQSMARGRERLNLLPPSFFLGAQFADFAGEFRGGVEEVHRHTLYHMRPYAAAGYTERIFFGETSGSATNGWADTNMQVAGAMAGNEAMVVQYVRVLFIPDPADYNAANTATPVSFGEMLELYQDRVWLQLTIADKPYVTGAPLLLFPAGMGPGSIVGGAATVLRNVSYAQNGSPDNRSLYLIDPPIAILPNRSFNVTIRWVVAQAVTTTTTSRLGVFLDGYRVRAVQ